MLSRWTLRRPPDGVPMFDALEGHCALPQGSANNPEVSAEADESSICFVVQAKGFIGGTDDRYAMGGLARLHAILHIRIFALFVSSISSVGFGESMTSRLALKDIGYKASPSSFVSRSTTAYRMPTAILRQMPIRSGGRTASVVALFVVSAAVRHVRRLALRDCCQMDPHHCGRTTTLQVCHGTLREVGIKLISAAFSCGLSCR